tara:strand:+ start:308 stop:730 length:423 start_codon:yes stop_codon:yes gene_type:complete
MGLSEEQKRAHAQKIKQLIQDLQKEDLLVAINVDDFLLPDDKLFAFFRMQKVRGYVVAAYHNPVSGDWENPRYEGSVKRIFRVSEDKIEELENSKAPATVNVAMTGFLRKINEKHGGFGEREVVKTTSFDDVPAQEQGRS